MASTFVYLGTYTPKGKGIHLFRLREDGDVPGNVRLEPLGAAAETPNPSFLDIDASRGLLFAVNEVDRLEGEPGGGVTAFAIERDSGRLRVVNTRSSKGAGPCHIVLDRTRRYVLVANYGGGSVVVLPVAPDGTLGEASAFVQHTGRSVDPERQQGPHAHCVALDAANRYAFVCDLGLDKVMAYRFDAARGTLAPANPPFTAVQPGAGPRHMVFRPDGRFAYVTNELNSTIDVFAYEAARGALAPVQTVSTLPQHWEGRSTTAEIDVHPSGRFLYVSNRGHDSIVLFRIDAANGTLTWVEDQSTGGARPRHFGIHPSGRYLAVGNQDSHTVLVCRIDDASGRLQPSGVFTSAPSPVCLKFLPALP